MVVADVVQSVDRDRLVTALDRGAGLALEGELRHTPLDITLQVDLGEGEDRGRGGVLPEDLPAFGQSTPLGRAGQPTELAPAYVFLASPESSFVVGETLNVNGGQPTP